MSSIVGRFNLDGRPVASADLQLMATASDRLADGSVRFWMAGSMGLGHISGWADTDQQPLVSRTGVAVALDGRLDNRDELSEPGERGPAGFSAGDTAYVFETYFKTGDRFASFLNGDFS